MWVELVQLVIDLVCEGYIFFVMEVERLINYQEDIVVFNDSDCVFVKDSWEIGEVLQ